MFSSALAPALPQKLVETTQSRSRERMHLEHERDYGLGMDSLVSVCTWNTNVIMVLAWVLW